MQRVITLVMIFEITLPIPYDIIDDMVLMLLRDMVKI